MYNEDSCIRTSVEDEFGWRQKTVETKNEQKEWRQVTNQPNERETSKVSLQTELQELKRRKNQNVANVCEFRPRAFSILYNKMT